MASLSDEVLMEIAECKHMSGGLGSLGAFRITLQNGDRVVLKAVQHPETEIFANVLARRMAEVLPWETPNFRYLPSGSPTSRVLLRAISQHSDDFEMLRKLTMLRKCPGFFLMDFIHGFSIYSLSKSQLSQLFAPSPSPTPSLFHNPLSVDDQPNNDKYTSREKSPLFALGAAILYDLLINNWDRLPLAHVWTNKGNPANIIFTAAPELTKERTSDGVYLIDQAVTAILHEQNSAHYCQIVHSLSSDARQQNSSPEPSSAEEVDTKSASEVTLRSACTSLHRFFLAEAQVDITSDGIELIEQGFTTALGILNKLIPSAEAWSAFMLSTAEEVVDWQTGDGTRPSTAIDLHIASSRDEKEKKEEKNVQSALPPNCTREDAYCRVCELQLKTPKKLAKHVSSSLHRMTAERLAQEATPGSKVQIL